MQKTEKFEKILDKWEDILGIRGTIFGVNGYGQKTLQIQLDGFLLNSLEPCFIEEAYILLYSELKKFLGLDFEMKFVKVENLDFATHIFWDLASLNWWEEVE